MQPPGRTLADRYVLGALLGSGGMARVYRAVDERLDVPVAIKVLTLSHPSIRQRLAREGRTQAALRHPNVVAVMDRIEVDEHPALVMELVEGPTLEALLAAGPLPLDQAELLFRGVAEGVRAAHALGIVHRDLKLANVLVARVGDRLLPKVADFGLAKSLGAASDTRSGVVMGTPRFMAPEQIRESRDVDERADVFALGAILFELVAGRPAFAAADTLSLFNAIAEGRVEPLPPGLPARFVAAIEGALTSDRDERLPSVEALLSVLDGDEGAPREVWDPELLARAAPAPAAAPSSETWAEETVAVPEPTEVPPPPRRSWPAWLLVVAALVAGAAWWLRPEPPPSFQPDAPPRISDGDEVQHLLDRAWAAYLANEDDRTRQLLDEALARGAEDPAVHLLAGALSLGHFDLEKAARRLAVGAELAEGQRGPVPELLRVLDGGFSEHEDYAWLDAALRDHLARWPDDHLARVLLGVGMIVLPADVPYDEALLTSLTDASPQSGAGWVVRVAATRRHRGPEAALGVSEEALARSEPSAALLAEVAVCHMVAGQMLQTLQRANEALRLNPGWWPARLHATTAAVHLGRADDFERLVAPMRAADETPVRVRRRFASYVARDLLSVGRVGDAATWREVAEAAAREDGDQAGILEARAFEVDMLLHPWVAGDATLREGLHRLDAAVADPTLTAAVRRQPGLTSLLAHGFLDARAGRLDLADQVLARLDDAPEAERLAVVLAQARGDIAGLEAVEGGCWTLVHRATGLIDLGAPERAGPLVSAARATCDGNNAQPHGLMALAAARIAAAAGDSEAEQAEREALRALWPEPDPDLPGFTAAEGRPRAEGTSSSGEEPGEHRPPPRSPR